MSIACNGVVGTANVARHVRPRKVVVVHNTQPSVMQCVLDLPACHDHSISGVSYWSGRERTIAPISRVEMVVTSDEGHFLGIKVSLVKLLKKGCKNEEARSRREAEIVSSSSSMED